MCLLDSVESWEPMKIRCYAFSHQNPQNPLRRKGRLESICGLEYAAQAMAVHIGLTKPPTALQSQIGYIGAVRNCVIHVPFLDQIPEKLEICATQIFLQNNSAIYEFVIAGRNEVLLGGRASIFLNRAKLDI